jgi:alpha-tubulin suppressor-like RCC1 family protein
MIQSSLAARAARVSAALPLALLAIAAIGCPGSSPTTAPPTVTTVVVTPGKDTLVVGASVQLAAAAFDQSGAPMSGVAFTWGPTGSAVASVSSTGKVTALTAGGPVNVTATAPNNVFGISAIVDTAVNAAVASVLVVPASVSIQLGAMTQLSDTVKDAMGNVLTGRVITWTSADPTKVSVSSSGLVTGVAVGGPIAVRAATGGKSDSSEVTVTPLPPVTYASISVGNSHACAMTAAGVAYCWGSGGQGQLGDNSFQAFFYKPIMVVGGQTWASVHAAGNYTCGVTTGGAPYCWGVGPRLGDNSNTSSSQPVAVAGSLTVDTMSSGNSATCVRKSTGALDCWGDNTYGQLGINSTFSGVDSTPQAVHQGGLVFTSLSSRGHFHSCALIATGNAYCWGDNSFGQLGLGTTTGADSVPVASAGVMTFSSIAAGGTFTCGITTTGSTYCWGDDAGGQLGDGLPSHITGTPTLVTGGHTFTSIVGGGGFACALTSAGAAWCWGLNFSGQLGDGTTNPSNVPVAVNGGLTFTSIAAGDLSVCGLVASGAAYCWGDNSSGELGINSSSTTNSTVPVAVASP